MLSYNYLGGESTMNDFFYTFTIWFLLFIIYSFIGWVFEVVLTLVKTGKFVNRGFLIGPVIPIWGAGCLLITLFLKDQSVLRLIIFSGTIGAILEYVVNYLMEKLFKARWWDYSHLPFNINGRIWLGSVLLFGFGGLFVVKFISPWIFKILHLFDLTMLYAIGGILLGVLLADIIISTGIIKNLKLSAEAMQQDYTVEITRKVKKVLEGKSNEFKRLLKAFPNVKFYRKK